MVKNAVVNAGLGRAAGMMVNEDGTLHPKAEGGVRRLLSVQRPIVLAYLRSLRRRHPEATPADIAEIVRSHYVNLTTGGGAAVGATAVVPGIRTGAAMGVAAVETAGFLEGSARRPSPSSTGSRCGIRSARTCSSWASCSGSPGGSW